MNIDEVEEDDEDDDEEEQDDDKNNNGQEEEEDIERMLKDAFNRHPRSSPPSEEGPIPHRQHRGAGDAAGDMLRQKQQPMTHHHRHHNPSAGDGGGGSFDSSTTAAQLGVEDVSGRTFSSDKKVYDRGFLFFF